MERVNIRDAVNTYSRNKVKPLVGATRDKIQNIVGKSVKKNVVKRTMKPVE